MPKKKSNHRKALEKIAANPSRYGFENIVASAIEVNLFNQRGEWDAQPDIIFLDSKGEVYVIEYKSNGDSRLIKRAKEQLYNTIQWFSKHTSIKPKTVIIDGSKYPELKRIR